MREARFRAAVLFGLLGVGCVYSFFFFNYNVDDASIYWRISQNIVSSGVYSYNTEGAPFDPSSGTAYVILGLLSEAAGLDTRLYFKVVGILVLSLFIYRATRFASRTNQDRWRYLAAAAFVLTPYTFVHAYSGLETLLFSYLLFELFVTVEGTEQCNSTPGIRTILIALLLTLTRWEGAVFAAFAAVFQISTTPRARSGVLVQWAAIFGLPVAIVILSRWWYFGDPLPTSFYFKTTVLDATERVRSLFWYHADRAKWFLLVLTMAVYAARKTPGGRLAPVWALLTVLTMTAYYSQAALFMNFADRFAFALVLPLLVYLCGKIEWRHFRSKQVVLPLMFLLWVPHEQGARVELRDLAQAFSHQSFLNKLGEILKPYAATGPVLATDVCGAVPYYSGWHAIDYFGLCHPELAKYRGSGQMAPREMLTGQTVDLLMLHDGSVNPSLFNYAMLTELVRSRRWIDVGSAEGLTLYMNPENESLRSLAPRLQALLQAARQTVPSLRTSVGVSLKPEGARFSAMSKAAPDREPGGR